MKQALLHMTNDTTLSSFWDTIASNRAEHVCYQKYTHSSERVQPLHVLIWYYNKRLESSHILSRPIEYDGHMYVKNCVEIAYPFMFGLFRII